MTSEEFEVLSKKTDISGTKVMIIACELSCKNHGARSDKETCVGKIATIIRVTPEVKRSIFLNTPDAARIKRNHFHYSEVALIKDSIKHDNPVKLDYDHNNYKTFLT